MHGNNTSMLCAGIELGRCHARAKWVHKFHARSRSMHAIALFSRCEGFSLWSRSVCAVVWERIPTNWPWEFGGVCILLFVIEARELQEPSTSLSHTHTNKIQGSRQFCPGSSVLQTSEDKCKAYAQRRENDEGT